MMSTQPRLRIEGDPAFRTLFRVSNDSILIVGEKGEELIDANPQALRAFGFSRKHIPKATVHELFTDATAIKTFYSSLWRQPHASHLNRVTCRHFSGRLIPVSISACMGVYRGRTCALTIIRDRTDCRLKKLISQARLPKLLRVVENLAALGHPLRQGLQLWLRQICCAAQFPAGHAHLLSHDLMESNAPADLWHVTSGKEWEFFRQNPSCIAFPQEFYSRVANSRTREVIADLASAPPFRRREIRALKLKSAVALPLVIGNTVAGVIVFLSSRLAEQDPMLVELVETLVREFGHMIQQRVLSSRIMRLQDEERRRLARELHDSTAQSMSMVILDLETVQREAETLSAKARMALSQSILLARQSVREIRTFSYLLHPPMLEELGLLPALRVFIEGFSRRSGIQVYKQLPTQLARMNSDWEMALFHAVQEGLTNVQRHSHSKTAEVRLSLGQGAGVLQVINEGVTVPSQAAGGLRRTDVGVGIASMRERVQSFGGSVELYSGENKTVLKVTLPIRRAAAAAAAHA